MICLRVEAVSLTYLTTGAQSLTYLTAETVSCISIWKLLFPCMPVRKRRRMG
jgi:hypothetical protein